MYDDRIGIQEVDTVFDDGSREEDIVFSRLKLDDIILQLDTTHLTVCDDDFGFIADDFFECLLHREDSLYPIVDVEDFPTAIELTVYCFLDRIRIIACYYRLDRLFATWRSCEYRELLHTRKCEIETSRYRCR